MFKNFRIWISDSRGEWIAKGNSIVGAYIVDMGNGVFDFRARTKSGRNVWLIGTMDQLAQRILMHPPVNRK